MVDPEAFAMLGFFLARNKWGKLPKELPLACFGNEFFFFEITAEFAGIERPGQNIRAFSGAFLAQEVI